MANALKKIGNFYNKFEEYLLVYSLVFTTLTIFLQIIMRFIFKNAFSWSEELTRYVFIWQIWLGASLAVREGVHIKVEIIFNILKGKAVYVAEIVSTLIWFAFCVFIVITSINIVTYAVQMHVISPAMQMPMSYAYASIPAGCAMMGIRLIGILYKQFKMLFGKGTPGDGLKEEVQQ